MMDPVGNDPISKRIEECGYKSMQDFLDCTKYSPKNLSWFLEERHRPYTYKGRLNRAATKLVDLLKCPAEILWPPQVAVKVWVDVVTGTAYGMCGDCLSSRYLKLIEAPVVTDRKLVKPRMSEPSEPVDFYSEAV